MTDTPRTYDPVAAEPRTPAEERIAFLERELDMLTKGGIIEVAVRNPNVAEYMRHWEDRAEAAERKLDKAQRPSNCRNRLRDEGFGYPRSGCASCGDGGMRGCPYERAPSTTTP